MRTNLRCLALLVLTAAGADAAEPAVNASGPAVLSRVRFFPAPGREQAMLGGRISGSNVSSTDGYVELAVIRRVPEPGQWTELTLAGTQVYRWIRYEAPPRLAWQRGGDRVLRGRPSLERAGIRQLRRSEVSQLAPRAGRQDRDLVRFRQRGRPVRRPRPGRSGDRAAAGAVARSRTACRARQGRAEVPYARRRGALHAGRHRARSGPRAALPPAHRDRQDHDVLGRGLPGGPCRQPGRVRHVFDRRLRQARLQHVPHRQQPHRHYRRLGDVCPHVRLPAHVHALHGARRAMRWLWSVDVVELKGAGQRRWRGSGTSTISRCSRGISSLPARPSTTCCSSTRSARSRRSSSPGCTWSGPSGSGCGPATWARSGLAGNCGSSGRR